MWTQEGLSKYSFVNIQGLKSEAGQKLNGAAGIVMTNKIATDAKGDTRYPVRIYAKRMEGSEELLVLDPAEDKKIKLENLVENAELPNEPQYEEATTKAIVRHDQNGERARNYKEMIWWMGCYYSAKSQRRFGYQYGMMLYEDGQVQKAASVLWEMYEELERKRVALGEPTSELFGPHSPCMLHASAMAWAETGEHLGEAMDYALRIPHDEESMQHLEVPVALLAQSKLRSQQAVSVVITALNRATRDNPESEEVATWNHWNFQGHRHMFARDPTNANAAHSIASMYCRVEDYLEGARWFRKALEIHNNPTMGDLTGGPEDTKRDLITAQMQCPGGPLENALVLYGQKTIKYVPKSQENQAVREFAQTRSAAALLNGMATMENLGDIQEIDCPDSPDDLTVFPASLLEQVRNFNPDN